MHLKQPKHSKSIFSVIFPFLRVSSLNWLNSCLKSAFHTYENIKKFCAFYFMTSLIVKKQTNPTFLWAGTQFHRSLCASKRKFYPSQSFNTVMGRSILSRSVKHCSHLSVHRNCKNRYIAINNTYSRQCSYVLSFGDNRD